MRDKVTLQRQSTTQDAMGHPVDTWADIETRRCDITPRTGREKLYQSGIYGDADVLISMRYDSTMAATRPFDRFVDRRNSPETIYDIQSVINVENRNRELLFVCTYPQTPRP